MERNQFSGFIAVRNIFDQYKHPENRLTHALATCLNESRPMLESFCRSIGHSLPSAKRAVVHEQYRPGRQARSEEEAEDLALPDIWIDCGTDWALVVESKLQHAISVEQLRRHSLLTSDIPHGKVVLISVRGPEQGVAAQFEWRSWTDVYNWAVHFNQDEWAARLSSYMEVLEREMISEGQLIDGALTTFSGIHFDPANPYQYTEAKRLLALLMRGVRATPGLLEELGVNPAHTGRKAIKGRAGFSVWDVLPLAPAGKAFNTAAHLTVAIRHDEAVAQLTIPHQVANGYRRAIIGSTAMDLEAASQLFLEGISKVLQSDPGCKPYVEIVQRHWPRGQSAPSVMDAELTFDPRTAYGAGMVKEQPEWLPMAAEIMASKKSNLQISIGARFPFSTSNLVKTHKLIDAMATVFRATRPLFAEAIVHRGKSTAE